MLLQSWAHTDIQHIARFSQGNNHKQISDRLRDAQSKRRILKAEVDLVNQKRDARIIEINTLQLQFEVKETLSIPPCQSFKLFPFMFFFIFCLYASVFSTGLAEEALTAGPRTAEADGEAAKLEPQ